MSAGEWLYNTINIPYDDYISDNDIIKKYNSIALISHDNWCRLIVVIYDCKGRIVPLTGEERYSIDLFKDIPHHIRPREDIHNDLTKCTDDIKEMFISYD